MKAILLLASLGLAALAGPYAVREFYHRVIAITHDGVPLDELLFCPACRERSVSRAESRSEYTCHRCGHEWLPGAWPRFSMTSDWPGGLSP